jgi:hypothetical protein
MSAIEACVLHFLRQGKRVVGGLGGGTAANRPLLETGFFMEPFFGHGWNTDETRMGIVLHPCSIRVSSVALQ